MPPIGWALGGVDFSNFFFVLKGDRAVDTLAEAAKAGKRVTINYGLFVNAVINFLIVALALFMLIRADQQAADPTAASRGGCAAAARRNPAAARNPRLPEGQGIGMKRALLCLVLSAAPGLRRRRCDDGGGQRLLCGVCRPGRSAAAFPTPRGGCALHPC